MVSEVGWHWQTDKSLCLSSRCAPSSVDYDMNTADKLLMMIVAHVATFSTGKGKLPTAHKICLLVGKRRGLSLLR